MGGGTFLVGAFILWTVQVLPASDRRTRERAAKEATFAETKCTVEHAESNTGRDNEGSEYTNMSVTFTLVVGEQRYPNIQYDYPGYWFNKASAKQALTRELVPGASITCFYDRESPTDAVLVKQGMPADDPPAPAFLQMFNLLGGLFMVLGVGFALFLKRWAPPPAGGND